MESIKQKPLLKEILPAVVFIGIIGAIFVLNLIIPTPDILEAERRVPARFPQPGAAEVFSGSFADGFEEWAADSFALRDTFRSINSFLVFEVYRQNDKEGLYRSGRVGLGKFTRLDRATMEETARRILKVSDSFDGLDMNVYYSLIPDKNIFSEAYLPGYSFALAENVMSEMLTDFGYISVRNNLNADSYYKTDLHWDQSKLEGAAYMLRTQMGAHLQTGNYEFESAGEFSGVYAGQYALPVQPDMMSFADIQGMKASYLNGETLEMEEGALYDFGGFAGIDPYDFYLSGPQPLVVIENGNAPGRELYMFRDSFGSSLAPLLSGSYSKITLIDLRYIHMGMAGRYVDFVPGSDVLFIYSSQILGNPSAIQG